MFYLVIWSWRTFATDKTIAPTPILLYCARCGIDISNRRRCHCQSYLRRISKPPSSITEDKISITPFINMYRHLCQLFGLGLHYKINKKMLLWEFSLFNNTKLVDKICIYMCFSSFFYSKSLCVYYYFGTNIVYL